MVIKDSYPKNGSVLSKFSLFGDSASDGFFAIDTFISFRIYSCNFFRLPSTNFKSYE